MNNLNTEREADDAVACESEETSVGEDTSNSVTNENRPPAFITRTNANASFQLVEDIDFWEKASKEALTLEALMSRFTETVTITRQSVAADLGNLFMGFDYSDGVVNRAEQLTKYEVLVMPLSMRKRLDKWLQHYVGDDILSDKFLRLKEWIQEGRIEDCTAITISVPTKEITTDPHWKLSFYDVIETLENLSAMASDAGKLYTADHMDTAATNLKDFIHFIKGQLKNQAIEHPLPDSDDVRYFVTRQSRY